MQKHDYYAAAIEFQIAIDLMPHAQGTAAYYLNLASVYDIQGNAEEVIRCAEKAAELNPMFFGCYLKAAEYYKKYGLIDVKLEEYKNKKSNPLNNIMIGLLYIQNGDISRGITILDNFCCEEEHLNITDGVRQYIEKIIKSNEKQHFL